MAEFRLRLAGLCSEKRDAGVEAYRPLATRIVVLLARHYNRETLDPTALWSRIETAILSGVEKRAGSPETMLSAMLEHVKAPAERVARDEDFAALLGELAAQDQAFLDGLAGYLRKATYAVMMFARSAWEAEKADKGKKRLGRQTPEDEAAALEAGEKPSGLFAQSEVDAALRERAEKRGETDHA